MPSGAREWKLRGMRLLAFVLVLLSGVSAAQAERKSFDVIDPYTKGDDDRIERAGYKSLGPFSLGGNLVTSRVAEIMKGVPLLWVETAHFKIGSGLPECGVDKADRERVLSELERLAVLLPDVKLRPKKLDAWLRLHLFALRLEETYAEFEQLFGLEDHDFPIQPPPAGAPAADYMGEGPYLGMPAKFEVLLFERKSDLALYSQAVEGKARSAPYQQLYPTVGALTYVTAAEFLEGEYANDAALTCFVRRAVAQLFSTGFRGPKVPVSFAWSEGLGHWFSRRYDPHYHFFSGKDPAANRITDEWNWAVGVRERVERKVFPSTAELLGWRAEDELDWAQHGILWSRIDFLLTLPDHKAGSVLRLLKHPAEAGELDLPEARVERARKAFQEGTGVDLAAFDVAWAEWVQRTYPKK